MKVHQICVLSLVLVMVGCFYFAVSAQTERDGPEVVAAVAPIYPAIAASARATVEGSLRDYRQTLEVRASEGFKI